MSKTDYGRFQTCEPVMADLLREAEKAALTQAHVYIHGPRGSGRGTLARWIQDRGPARAARVLTWNRASVVSVADGDTVFIENIHEFDPVQLERVREALDRQTVGPACRVRFLVTSELDPKDWISTSPVARDLAYRLCILNLRMPSLQERSRDIRDLAKLFLRVCCLVNGLPEKSFLADAMDLLERRPWPGNVSELANVVERAALSSEGKEIRAGDFSFLEAAGEKDPFELAQVGMSLFEVERKLIYQTLEFTGQNKTRAAQILGISIRTLRNKLNNYRQERGGPDEHHVR